ncbi:ankyrin repeat and protein kinase domain-containing protein 1 [Oryzias melastigma]|uniref:Ankyrin repeat and kinase domain containing 1 n=1 Tax=Oryzias melastigma TaxID=30732 RepID=A0A3B3C7P8_ORYME|nr:ankyrin repeat and protein kinase domain-containing protein 1 [Oryzias melastigma]
MDCLDQSPGQFTDFKKGDFEANWTKLAESKFGHVYQVKLKLLREKCTLKTFDTILNANNYRKIIDEVSKIAQLKCKYIISIYGMCSEASAVVMEYMSNGSLYSLLASYSFMWSKKFQMIHEIAMGMNFLHSMKPPLLHLNLKTSNILLDDHLHVKIADFGLIHWEEGMNKNAFTEYLIARGNIRYSPPEIFTQSSGPPGTTFDVYSFGIVMWEILSQKKPYPGCSVPAVILQVSQGKRPCLDFLPAPRPSECDEMICIMKQCWNQDHTKRPLFLDTVRKTERLNEGLKIPGPMGCQNNGDAKQESYYSWLISPVHQDSFAEKLNFSSDDQNVEDGVLSLLTKKDFGSFRQSVKQEHVCMQFSGQKSLLHFTVASGDLESVKHVLSLGAEVNSVTAKGYTPLIIAVLQRFHDIIPFLLEHGASVTQGDEDQWTALHFAAQNGDDRIVRILLDKGALPNAREKSGWIPLHLAAQNGHESVVRLLISRSSEEAIVEREEENGRTPIHLAAFYGHLNIVKLLLTLKADPNGTDSSLSTALHLSAERGHNRVVRHLLKFGAKTDTTDKRGCTPLHLAALWGHAGICRQLLSNGANPESKNLQGWTPIHLAALKGHEGVVVQLSQDGCVNSKGQNGWTPLHFACHQGQADVVAKLLAAKADPNIAEDSNGWTPLHIACNRVSLPCVLNLISYQADVNAVNSEKETPLHLAAQHGCEPIVKVLLMNGADGTILDSSGSTAVDVARRNEKLETLHLLELEFAEYQT